MGGVRWDCLRPSVFPYHPINLLLFIFSNPDRLPFPFPFLTSLTLFPCKEISRLAVSVSCVTWEDFWVITKCTKLIWGNHRATTVFSWLNSQSTFTLPQCNPQLVILTMTVFLTSTALPIKLSPPCFCPSLWVRKHKPPGWFLAPLFPSDGANNGEKQCQCLGFMHWLLSSVLHVLIPFIGISWITLEIQLKPNGRI